MAYEKVKKFSQDLAVVMKTKSTNTEEDRITVGSYRFDLVQGLFDSYISFILIEILE